MVEGLRDGKNVEMFPCPTCRSEFSLKSNENVEGMVANYFIRNMLEVMTLQQEAKVCSLRGSLYTVFQLRLSFQKCKL